MRKLQGLIITAIAAVIVITMGVIVAKQSSPSPDTAFLERNGLAGLSVEEIVYKLDSSTTDPSGLKAGITSEYLILMDSKEEIRLQLPEDKFYLSFAPYLDQTHPCRTHSLSSCQGELVNQQIRTVITDSEGNEIVNSDLTTQENGFVGVWLPRNMTATLTVSSNGLTAQAPITTFTGSDTCLTTPLQLKG